MVLWRHGMDAFAHTFFYMLLLEQNHLLLINNTVYEEAQTLLTYLKKTYF